MQKALAVEHVFSSPVFSFHYMNRLATFGNVILSKYPFQKTETTFTHQEFRENFDVSENGGMNMRNLQHAVIDLPEGKKLHVLNHHGHHIHHHKNGNEETLRQCTFIADYAKKLEGPVILTGDFNLHPSSDSIEKINAVLSNLSLQRKLTTTRTEFTSKTEVCDYIFVSKEVKVDSFRASDRLLSDHKALELEFSL